MIENGRSLYYSCKHHSHLSKMLTWPIDNLWPTCCLRRKQTQNVDWISANSSKKKKTSPNYLCVSQGISTQTRLKNHSLVKTVGCLLFWESLKLGWVLLEIFLTICYFLKYGSPYTLFQKSLFCPKNIEIRVGPIWKLLL